MNSYTVSHGGVSHHSPVYHTICMDLTMAAEYCRVAKSRGYTVGTTNGCFYLLHPGHLALFDECKLHCNFLIVMVNTDEYIVKRKGRRPVIPFHDRMRILASLKQVDLVVPMVEDDPREALRTLLPSIHFNSSEYGSDCIEAEVVKGIGAELVLVDRVKEYSTTVIIESLRSQA